MTSQRLIYTWLCLLMLVGCSAVSVVEPTRYALNGMSEKKLAKYSSSHVVFVSDLKASSAYTSSDMIYTKKSLIINAFANNEWVASPAKMLRSVLVASLQNTGYFKGVLSSAMPVKARFQVNATVLRLRQSFQTMPSTVNLTLKMDVIDTVRGNVIASKRFSENKTAKLDSPYGGVLAANDASKALMLRIANFIVTVCRSA